MTCRDLFGRTAACRDIARLRPHCARGRIGARMLAVCASVFAVGCGPGESVSNAAESTNTSTSAPRTEPADQLELIVARGRHGKVPPATSVTCDGYTTFRLSALRHLVPVSERKLPGVQTGLQDFLADAGAPWPQTGWMVLTRSDEHVELIYVDGDNVGFMSFHSTAAGWKWDGSSLNDRCVLRTALPTGLGEVKWWLDRHFARPNADTTIVHVLVTEQECASGKPMRGRLRGPQIVETKETVLVAFAAAIQRGAQTCPGNPATAATVRLSHPLGDRKLRDGRIITRDLAKLITTAPATAPDS